MPDCKKKEEEDEDGAAREGSVEERIKKTSGEKCVLRVAVLLVFRSRRSLRKDSAFSTFRYPFGFFLLLFFVRKNLTTNT